MIKENFQKVSGLIRKKNIDALLINNPSDLLYLSGSSVTGYLLLVFQDGARVISSPLLYGQLRKIFAGYPVMLSKEPAEEIKKAISVNGKAKKIGINPASVTLQFYKKLLRGLGKHAVRQTPGILEEARQEKNGEEIAKIRESCLIAVKTMRFVKRILKPGITEISAAIKIKKMFLDFGAESAFEPIVAAGRNSAFPHHLSGDDKLPENGPVIVDIGCRRNGYCSDLTRVFFLGKINPVLRRYYDNVISARLLALHALKPGVKTCEIDLKARSFLNGKGVGGLFIHSTGHGIGIDVHEKPFVSANGKDKLLKGMVITVEPGLYKPGAGGIRVEDTVLVTEKGFEILTKGV